MGSVTAPVLVGSEMQDLAPLLGVCLLCFSVALVPSLTQKDHKSQFNRIVQFSR